MRPPPDDDAPGELLTPTLIRRDGWICRVIKNEDDDGWAVEMTRVGDAEPVLVGPWTMGRDKKNPKPLDVQAFHTLVKTAGDVLRRHENALHARLHRSLSWTAADGRRLRASLDIAPDEDDPRATLSIVDAVTGEPVRSGTVSPGYRLSAERLDRFVAGGEG